MPEKSQEKSLILASSSPYRKIMLERLRLPFSVHSADVDESALAQEPVGEQVIRLARLKAHAIAAEQPGSVVIGCDQLAHCEGRTVGKPGNESRAAAQLASFSGRTVEFLSALCVVDRATDSEYTDVVSTRVRFRVLQPDEILRYIEADRPVDCAGAFKSECLGSTLLESMSSEDPTAIIGLPLISLSSMLRRCGFQLP